MSKIGHPQVPFYFRRDLGPSRGVTAKRRGDEFLTLSVGRHGSAAAHARAKRKCPQHADPVDDTILNVIVSQDIQRPVDQAKMYDKGQEFAQASRRSGMVDGMMNLQQ